MKRSVGDRRGSALILPTIIVLTSRKSTPVKLRAPPRRHPGTRLRARDSKVKERTAPQLPEIRRMTTAASDPTEVGSYFIANYPPFSVWTEEAVERDVRPALAAPPTGVPLGLYLHIPFCRKRCHFCYFRVYTDKNAAEVQVYLDTLAREWELYNEQPAVAGRPLNFVYFGGGTPSFLSVRQLQGLVDRMDAVSSWRTAEEITFECEPGTLSEAKLTALREIGVTRLSLGVENFDDRLLEINGRAHRSPEIDKAYAFAQSLAFPQINIDLIAGMLGETDENWRDCVQRTIDLAPDSVTIYQM